MFHEMIADFKEMNVWELMASAFILITTGLYIYQMGRACLP